MSDVRGISNHDILGSIFPKWECVIRFRILIVGAWLNERGITTLVT